MFLKMPVEKRLQANALIFESQILHLCGFTGISETVSERGAMGSSSTESLAAQISGVQLLSSVELQLENIEQRDGFDPSLE